MRIGINLAPTGDWPAILAAAQMADVSGFDALSFLDHYHAPKLEWPYLCGWSLYGALAMVTSRIHLVPMVIDRLNYLPRVLAKEISTLSILSAGRFELGIGAGDFFEEAQAWGLTVPDVAARITGLKETVVVLRRIWSGEQVTFEGEQLHLVNAASTPAPAIPPRVVIGAGSSRLLQKLHAQHQALDLVGAAFDFVGIVGEVDVLDHGAALEHGGRAFQLQVLDQRDGVALGEQRAV